MTAWLRFFPGPGGWAGVRNTIPRAPLPCRPAASSGISRNRSTTTARRTWRPCSRSWAKAPKPPRTPNRSSLLGVHFDHFEGDHLGHQHLMRHLRGDVNHIANSHLLADAALDRSPASLARSGGMRSLDGSTDDQCALAGGHENHVHLGIVDFRFAVSLAPDHQQSVIAPVAHAVERDLVLVNFDRCIVSLNLRAGPHLKSVRIGRQ